MFNYLYINYNNFDTGHFFKCSNYSEDYIEIHATNKFNQNEWTEKGLNKCKYNIVDTGNEVIIKLSKKKIKLDYSELETVNILVKLWERKNNHSFNISFINELNSEGIV